MTVVFSYDSLLYLQLIKSINNDEENIISVSLISVHQCLLKSFLGNH